MENNDALLNQDININTPDNITNLYDHPTEDILIENIRICPIDDHLTMGVM